MERSLILPLTLSKFIGLPMSPPATPVGILSMLLSGGAAIEMAFPSLRFFYRACPIAGGGMVKKG
jgi:hypothetical protein